MSTPNSILLETLDDIVCATGSATCVTIPVSLKLALSLLEVIFPEFWEDHIGQTVDDLVLYYPDDQTWLYQIFYHISEGDIPFMDDIQMIDSKETPRAAWAIFCIGCEISGAPLEFRPE